MCDIKKSVSIDVSVIGRLTAAGTCDSSSDTISMISENAGDLTDHKVISQQLYKQQQIKNQQKLQQTTQSLRMASAMLVDSSNVVDVNNDCSSNSNSKNDASFVDHDVIDDDISSINHRGHINSNIYGSTDSMIPATASVSNNASVMHINVYEIIMENQALRENLKEVTIDRDKLLCEVSNLRLELDMLKLKRLPEDM